MSVANCDICKHQKTDLCKECYVSPAWGKCYFERDESKEEDRNVFFSKDKLYEFVDVNTTGKPIEFRTKRQWRAHLKRLGMTDDIYQGRIYDERHFKKPVKENKEEKRREYGNLIRQEMKEKGIYDSQKLFVRR